MGGLLSRWLGRRERAFGEPELTIKRSCEGLKVLTAAHDTAWGRLQHGSQLLSRINLAGTFRPDALETVPYTAWRPSRADVPFRTVSA